MKKYFAASLLLLFAYSVFPQDNLKNKDYYLQKSKSQKTVAWILLGGGTATMITGSAIWINAFEEDIFTTNSTGPGLFVAGLIVSIASIPLFIASGKNRKRAASLSFNNLRTPQIKNSSMVYRPIPAVSLKINL